MRKVEFAFRLSLKLWIWLPFILKVCKKWNLEWYGIDKRTIKQQNKDTVTLTGYLIGFSILYSL